MVKKLYPLCENHLFSKAYRKGKSDANRYVAVYVLKNYSVDTLLHIRKTKLGITVNKKLGKAHKRNRAKRVIRAAFRELLPNIADGYLIIIAARGALFHPHVKTADVTPLLRDSLKKLGVLNAS